MYKIVIVFFWVSIAFLQKSIAQNFDTKADSIMIKSFFDTELKEGQAYSNLRTLCMKHPKRLSGSKGLQDAILFAEKLMKSYNFDKVYLQETSVPHWERGEKEQAKIWIKKDKPFVLSVCALGGSVPTVKEGLQGKLFEIKEWTDWVKYGTKGQLKDKIVFVNIPMSATIINTFEAYGHCWNVRGNSAIEGARYGAKAVIIRSLSQTINQHPHTGSMYYNDSLPQIPAMAMSTKDAEFVSNLMINSEPQIWIKQSCKTYKDTISYNVIAEQKGTVASSKFITIGGHLDAWDLGEGAHDDGAGVMQCLDALWLLKKYSKPKNNIRCVFFTNEENGSRGGKMYAKKATENKETHVFALESDAGGFVPRGFGIDAKPNEIEYYKKLIDLLIPYYMSDFRPKGGGVDIGPLRASGTVLSDLLPDSQRYFDVHHAASDVFSQVNERELHLGAAGIASVVFLIDKYGIAH